MIVSQALVVDVNNHLETLSHKKAVQFIIFIFLEPPYL